MIKIGEHFYVHFTTPILFLVCWFNRRLELLLISYAVMFFHELAHLVAASVIGLKMSRLVFYPFGVNLKLKNTIIYGMCDEIILYLAGPFFNIAMALFASFFVCKNSCWNIFYCNNIALFIFNLLPIVPMDGGMVLSKILARKSGIKQSETAMKLISGILIAVLIGFETYLIINKGFDYTMLFIIIFLTANLFTNREKYRTNLMHELMFYRKKGDFAYKKVKSYVIKENTDLRKLAENFAQNHYYIIFTEDSQGKICSVRSEKEIADKILSGQIY